MKKYQKIFNIFLGLILSLGILFRFVNLDQKLYWYDEVYTSFRLSGYTFNEVYQVVANRIISIEDLQKYQQINSEKNVVDTVKSLAIEEPQLTPLYFIILRFWTQVFGDSITTIRSFSAWNSLLVFPSAYWLCQELFQSSFIGWIAIALLAVSPLQLLYAQEARPYSLWVVTILVSSAALLRAIQTKKLKDWSLYTLSVFVGLYTHLLFVLVAIAQGLYVVLKERFRWTQTLKGYWVNAVISMVLFLPWILISIWFSLLRLTLKNSSQSDSQTPIILQSPLGGNKMVSLLTKSILNLSRNFVDFDTSFIHFTLQPNFSNPQILTQQILILASFCLVAYTLYWIIFKQPNEANLFCLCLIAVPAFTLMLVDLKLGSSRVPLRYLLPSYVGVQIAIAYLVGTQIKFQNSSRIRQQVWALIFITLISVETFSCLISLPAQNWWNKNINGYNPKMAALINQAENPLLVTQLENYPFFSMVSLSYFLEPNTKFLPLTLDNPKVPSSANQIFVFGLPEKNWQTSLEHTSNVQLIPVYKNQLNRFWLWKISQPQASRTIP